MLLCLKKTVSLVLALVMFAVTPAPVIADTRASGPQFFTPDFNLKGLQAQEPMLKEFAEATWAPPKYGPFDASDPVLDNDPFFMRSESYTSVFSHPAGDGTAFQIEGNSILIHVAGTNRALRIDQRLAPVGEYEHFIFLQARDNSLFTAKAANEDFYGEGLFFIDKRDIQLELNRPTDPRPVPVLFFPLAGTGWTEKIDALVVEPVAIPAFRNAAGESATIELQHIYELSRLEHNNLVFGIILAVKNDPAAIHLMQANWAGGTPDPTQLPFVLPPRGSTAVFGAFFSGVNLDHPELGLSGLSNQHTLNLDLLPSAHASFLTPDVLDRLLTVGMITGATYVTGLMAQYTILRERMLERRAGIESREDALALQKGNSIKDRTSVWFKGKREALETIDVFSHGLATISSAPGTTAGYLLEYSADRFAEMVGAPPAGRIRSFINKTVRSGAAPNGLIRRFLSYTFLYFRKQNEYIGANWMCFYLGVLILGGIDTVGVVLQLQTISPIFFPWVSQIFGANKHAEVVAQFEGAHAANQNVITSEIMRNISGYFVAGSYQYSSDQRQTLMEIIRPDVEREMKFEGLDPLDPNNLIEMTRRIENRLEVMLVERGLPSRKEFLFSGPSVVRSIMGLMGYQVDRTELETSADYKKDKRARIDSGKFEEGLKVETFMLERARYGLISHSLKVALQSLLDLAKDETGNARLQTAIAMLREMIADYHVVRAAFSNPLKAPEAIRKAYRIRKILTLFSYDGEIVGGGVKYLDLWQNAKNDPQAATIAARAYRQAFFATIQGRPEAVKPSLADIERYGAEARAEATAAMQTTAPEIGFDDTDLLIATLEIVKKKAEAATERAELAKWRPPAPSMYERLQRGRAHEAAMVAVHDDLAGSEYENPAFEVALARGDLGEAVGALRRDILRPEVTELILEDNRAKQIYRIAYRDAMAKQVGLRALPDDKSELVRKADELASADIQGNITGNEAWQRYIDDLEPMDRIRFLAHQYADVFLAKYVQLTVSNSAVIGLTSPEQPGFFQKLRQKALPNSKGFVGKLVKTVLRIAESPMDTTAYRPGFSNALRRNIPWYQDFKTHSQLKWRGMWVSLSVGWAAQYFIWQVKFPWPTAFFFLWTSLFLSIAHSWMDRIMMNAGMPPMKTATGKFVYSNVWTWLSYPTYIPFFFYYQDFNRLFQSFITGPLTSVVQSCAELLGI